MLATVRAAWGASARRAGDDRRLSFAFRAEAPRESVGSASPRGALRHRAPRREGDRGKLGIVRPPIGGERRAERRARGAHAPLAHGGGPARDRWECAARGGGEVSAAREVRRLGRSPLGPGPPRRRGGRAPRRARRREERGVVRPPRGSRGRFVGWSCGGKGARRPRAREEPGRVRTFASGGAPRTERRDRPPGGYDPRHRPRLHALRSATNLRRHLSRL